MNVIYEGVHMPYLEKNAVNNQFYVSDGWYLWRVCEL